MVANAFVTATVLNNDGVAAVATMAALFFADCRCYGDDSR